MPFISATYSSAFHARVDQGGDASLRVFQRMLGRVETADAVVDELAIR